MTILFLLSTRLLELLGQSIGKNSGRMSVQELPAIADSKRIIKKLLF